jgi:hypothetical protein
VEPQEPEGHRAAAIALPARAVQQGLRAGAGAVPGVGGGLSASAITRLTEAWQEEYRRWCDRDLSGAGYVYGWADGLHFGVRLDADRVCTLVVVGVRARREEGAGRAR